MAQMNLGFRRRRTYSGENHFQLPPKPSLHSYLGWFLEPARILFVVSAWSKV